MDAFFEASAILDEKNLPLLAAAVLRRGSIMHWYRKSIQIFLTEITEIIRAALIGGEGLYEIAGISSVVLTTCLSWLVMLPVDGENNDYSGDFSAHCGLIYQRDAAGVVEGIGPGVKQRAEM